MRRSHRPETGARRRVNVRAENPRILIVCEGEQTERLYFKAFGASNASVVGTGFNTISLVEEANRRNVGVHYDQVWCVFDKDSFSADDFQAAIDLAKSVFTEG